MRILFLLLTAILVNASQVMADTDEGLYDPVAPEGSAFVRFVNGDEDTVKASVNEKKHYGVNPFTATPYYVVKAGDVTLSINDKSAEQAIEEGSFYTVVEMEDVVVIQDAANDNRAKATVALYNLEDHGAVSLKAKEGTVTVIEAVEKGQNNARDINPVKIDLSITQDGDTSVALKPIILERGNHYSVFYSGGDTFIVRAETDTTR